MTVDDEQVTFNVFNAMRYPEEVEECSVVNIVDSVVSEQFHKKYSASVTDTPSLEGLEEKSEDQDAQVAWLDKNQPISGEQENLSLWNCRRGSSNPLDHLLKNHPLWS